MLSAVLGGGEPEHTFVQSVAGGSKLCATWPSKSGTLKSHAARTTKRWHLGVVVERARPLEADSAAPPA